MRLLFVHADRVAFEVGETDDADAPAAGRMDDCVAAFVTVEASDRADPDAAVANAADAVRDAADRLNARKAVLRPSAHLGDDPADREVAETAVRKLEAELGELEVLRAPFGWYETFEVASKGHPFAEFSRRVTTERPDERGPTEWRLLFPDGRVRDPGAADDALDDQTGSLVAEIEGEASSAGSATDLLREQGLADGDPGERRWYPRGALVRDSLREYATDLAVEHGAAVVETPGHADPLAALADDARERDGPVRLYGTSDGSFGTLVAATPDADAAREEVRAQVRLAREACAALGLDARPVVRATRAFYDRDEAWVASLVADRDAPAPLELLSERPGDPSLAVELTVLDGRDRPLTAASVRLDAETDGAPVVRWSLTERAVDAAVAAAAERTPPRLPTWLAPTQVRLVPVEESHAERCDALAAELEAAGVRADVDDREATVGERIARAEADWVPYYAVVGDRERDGEALPVNVRANGEQRELTIAELRDAVLAASEGLPARRRNRPRRLNRRPRFADQ